MAQLDESIVSGQADHIADHQTLHAKANYVNDVTDFGAVGDLVTDDTAAIQSAIDDFSGQRGIIYFPTSTLGYLCSSAGLDAKRVHFLGARVPGNAGDGGTKLMFDSTYGISSSLEDNFGYGISEMEIVGSNEGTPTASGQILVDFTGQNYPRLNNVRLRRGDRGVLLKKGATIECHYGLFTHVNPNECFVGVEIAAAGTASEHTFVGGRHWSCETGVLIGANANDISFFGTAFENGAGNLGVDSTGTDITFCGVRWETLGTNLTVRSGAGDHWVFGGRFSSGTDIADANDPTVVYGIARSADPIALRGGISIDDIEVADTNKGFILKSADSTRYRITVADNGTLGTETV